MKRTSIFKRTDKANEIRNMKTEVKKKSKAEQQQCNSLSPS